MEKINIVLTSSEYYAPYTYVLMQSILENTRRDVKFYILTTDIKAETINKFNYLKRIRNCEIEFVTVSTSKYPQPKQIRVNPVVYARMNLPSILPHLKKCLVLDSDIIVTTDVAKIYDVDLTNKYVAWVKDPVDRELRETPSRLDRFDIPKTIPYINSGVLVFNLEEYKKDNIEQKLIDNYNKYKNDICFFDQDLFYITLSSKCLILDYKYNYLPTLQYDKSGLNEELDISAEVIHYGTDEKPWIYPNSSKAEIWWEYARKTPYYESLFMEMITNIVNYRNDYTYAKLILSYWKYKILSSICIGKRKKFYVEKRNAMKNKVIAARRIKMINRTV